MTTMTRKLLTTAGLGALALFNAAWIVVLVASLPFAVGVVVVAAGTVGGCMLADTIVDVWVGDVAAE